MLKWIVAAVLFIPMTFLWLFGYVMSAFFYVANGVSDGVSDGFEMVWDFFSNLSDKIDARR